MVIVGEQVSTAVGASEEDHAQVHRLCRGAGAVKRHELINRPGCGDNTDAFWREVKNPQVQKLKPNHYRRPR